MAGADGAGRRAGGLAAVCPLLLALLVTGGCSALSAHDDSADAQPGTTAVEVPPPPAAAGPGASGASTASRAAQTATRIERVAIDSAPPTTRVVLQLDGSAEPEVSLLANQRLVIDVPGTTCASLPRVVEAAGDPLVERVRTGQHGPPENKSRIVIDLRARADFSVRAQGDRIVAYLAPADAASAGAAPGPSDPSRILFGAEGVAGGARPAEVAASPAPSASPAAALPADAASAGALAATPTPTPVVRAAEPTPEAPGIAAVAAAAATMPAANAFPTATETTAPSRADEAPALAVDAAPTTSPAPILAAAPSPATPPGAELGASSAPSAELVLPAEVTPTGSAWAEIVPSATTDGHAQPSLPAPPDLPPSATVAASTGASEGAPAAASAPEATPRPPAGAEPAVEATRVTSKRISIDFTEADVRTVIELIAGAGGYHVLFTPDVGGTITISLVDRPWEDALVTVLRARRLREVRQDDVMLVSPVGR